MVHPTMAQGTWLFIEQDPGCGSRMAVSEIWVELRSSLRNAKNDSRGDERGGAVCVQVRGWLHVGGIIVCSESRDGLTRPKTLGRSAAGGVTSISENESEEQVDVEF
jgi:hypothetical protein